MPNVLVREQIDLAELAQSVDDGRLASDTFKFSASPTNSATSATTPKGTRRKAIM